MDYEERGRDRWRSRNRELKRDRGKKLNGKKDKKELEIC